ASFPRGERKQRIECGRLGAVSAPSSLTLACPVVVTQQPEDDHVPIYEYRCKKCGNSWDLMRRIAQRDDKAPCPECRSRARRRVGMQRIAGLTGTRPDAMMGEGEPEDFLGGGDDFGGFDDFGDAF